MSIPQQHSPSGNISNRISVLRLLTRLSSHLNPTSKHPQKAFDHLLNTIIPCRYVDDDDDILSPSPSSLSPATEEQREQESPSHPPFLPSSPRHLRLRDELTCYLFLLRSCGHYDRANAVQLLVDRLRLQRSVTFPSSLLPSSSSSSSTFPFTASPVLILLLELAGTGDQWNAIPSPLLLDLQRAYDNPSLSSSLILPPSSSSLPASVTSPSLLDAYGLRWEEKPSDLVEDAWLIDKRIASSFILSPLTPFPPPPPPPSLSSPALFSFQKGNPSKSSREEWSSSLSSPPSHFLDLALTHAGVEGRDAVMYEKRQRSRQLAKSEGAAFNRAWEVHQRELRRPEKGEAEIVWQRVGECPPPPPAPISAVDNFQWGEGGEFSPASLNLFGHPDLFNRLYMASLSSVFPPSVPVLPNNDLLLRSALLVMQAIPSSLFLLSSSNNFTLAPSASGSKVPSSSIPILQSCAETGTQLHTIERLAETLQSAGLIAQGLASALLSFSSHCKQQIASLPSLSLLHLHCHALAVQERVRWVYDLLHPFSMELPSGCELLAALYDRCLMLPVSSPFFSILTSLFHSTLSSFLLLLHAFLYHGQPLPSELLLPSQALQLPVFLSSEAQKLSSAGRLLHLLDGAGREWAACCDNFGVPVLQVGYSVRDIDRMKGWREELTRKQEGRLNERVVEEERKVIAAKEAVRAEFLRKAAMARRLVSEGDEEEEEEAREKRRRQAEYQRQLNEQRKEKARRQEEEKEKERLDREKEAQKRQEERRIIEEEKARLLAVIKATEEGKSEHQMKRDEWRKRRQKSSGKLATLIHSEEAQCAEQMAEEGAKAPEPGEVDGEDGSEEEEFADADTDYHTDDEAQSQSPSEPESPPHRLAPVSTSLNRSFAFSYDSPAARSSSHSSPHFFSPSPRHAPTDSEEDNPDLSALQVPSPRAAASSSSEGSRQGSKGWGQRRFVFDEVPSPRSGLDSAASSSPARSPRHGRHSSGESLSSVMTSASERITPRVAVVEEGKEGEEKREEHEVGEVKETEGVRGGSDVQNERKEYNWNESFDWAAAVVEEEAAEAHAILRYGDNGEKGWTDDEEEEARLRTQSFSSSSEEEVEKALPQHAERAQSRTRNRHRNTSSSVTFASVEEEEMQGSKEQEELIRLMEAKEAQRASNEARGLARERNLSSRVFDEGGGEMARRSESSQLTINRQRMMASNVFPEQLTSDEKQAEHKDAEAEVSPPGLVEQPTVLAPEMEKKYDESIAAEQASQKEGKVAEPESLEKVKEEANTSVDVSSLALRLPLDEAIRSSLIPALHAQCSMIDRATLSFFLHHLHVFSHLHALNRFFFMQQGDLIGTFTASLFTFFKFHPPTPSTLLHHWQHASSLHPSPFSSLVSFSVSSDHPASSLRQVEGMEEVDSVRMEYRVEGPLREVIGEEARRSYGKVFNLLLRVMLVRSEMQQLFLWIRSQDAIIRKQETLHHLTLSSSTTKEKQTSRPSTAKAKTSAATDDLFLLSPTKRRAPTASPSPFSPTRDDDLYQQQRSAVSSARQQLEALVHARWRLRWLHGVRAEMTHAVSTLHHHLHISCIATQSADFFSQLPSVRSLSDLQALHSAFLSSLLSSLFLSSPSPLASLLEAVLSTVLVFAQSVPGLRLDGRDGEVWQSVRDVSRQFRSHGVFLSRVLHFMQEEGRTEAACLDSTFGFTGFYSKLRQRELEDSVLR